jgi:solute carrier family 25 (mitochondrial phosphate transporter), member 23/24/25/41
MSTFETLKLSYCQHFELEEPETYAVLAFGAISGGVGATSVYPINVLRTKLQASGSTGHPQTYTGFADVTRKTISREGWRGLYKGLTVTLAKVVPAVSISYVVGFPLLSSLRRLASGRGDNRLTRPFAPTPQVYEDSKRKLGL